MALEGLDLPHLVAIAAALGWASGLRLYAVVFLTGAAGWMGWVTLPPGLQVLQNPLLLGAAGLMCLMEFVADKIPGLDTLWDAVHTLIRIPAGAALAAGAFGGDSTTWSLVAALLGGTLAAGAHVAKATARAAANTSPEPFSNIGLSLAGDALVPAGLWLAVSHPLVFGLFLVLVLVLSVWLIRKSWRFLRGLFTRVARIFSGRPDPGVVPAFRIGKDSSVDTPHV